jgi:hypothetical protein
MRRLIVLTALVLSGCQNVIGPREPRQPVRIDDPRVPIVEQERRGRDRLALPDSSPNLLPQTSGETRPMSQNLGR